MYRYIWDLVSIGLFRLQNLRAQFIHSINPSVAVRVIALRVRIKPEYWE